MMKIKTFVVNPLRVNLYVLSDETRECALVDCGCLDPEEWVMVERYIEAEGLIPKRLWQTHMHFDHVFGLDFAMQRYGLLPECHPLEEQIYEQNPEMAYRLCGVRMPLPAARIGGWLNEGDTVTFGHTELRVIHTPGHTAGCICLYCEADGALLSGDTLFRGSVGRTDHATGDMEQEIDSVLTRLMTLPPHTAVYPGHGPTTTIATEARTNPYLTIH